MIVAALLPGAARLSAQGCQMSFNVSVYQDGSVSGDLSTVYAYSNFVDQSITCQCVHSSYESYAEVEAPDGSYVEGSASGNESETSMETGGQLGTYNVYGAALFQCSCYGQVGGGGGPVPVAVNAQLTLTVSQTSCTVPRQNGTCQFVIGAVAGGGFGGQVTGNLTVSLQEASEEFR